MESEQAHFGGSKKRKKMIWPLFLPLKNVFFWIFPIFGVKGVFWILFWIFKNLKSVLESQKAHLGGSKKEKIQFDHYFCIFGILRGD